MRLLSHEYNGLILDSLSWKNFVVIADIKHMIPIKLILIMTKVEYIHTYDIGNFTNKQINNIILQSIKTIKYIIGGSFINTIYCKNLLCCNNSDSINNIDLPNLKLTLGVHLNTESIYAPYDQLDKFKNAKYVYLADSPGTLNNFEKKYDVLVVITRLTITPILEFLKYFKVILVSHTAKLEIQEHATHRFTYRKFVIDYHDDHVYDSFYDIEGNLVYQIKLM
jgi:hypothetical protein